MTPSECLEAIRARTRDFPELQKAHHFLFDLHIQPALAAEKVEVLEISLNPAENPAQELSHPRSALPSGRTIWEETSESDFMDPGHIGRATPDSRGRYAVPWTKDILKFFGTERVVQSAVFFWSSRDTRADFLNRFGEPLAKSKHLSFCKDMNLALVDHYQPKVVVTAGIGDSTRIARLYGLNLVDQVAINGRRLVARYEMSDGRPWIFTRHWSGARPPLGQDEILAVKAYVQRFIQAAEPALLGAETRDLLPQKSSATPTRKRGSVKDYTKYTIDGSEPLAKRHLALAIIHAWRMKNPTSSRSDFETAFSSVRHPRGLIAEASTVTSDPRRFAADGQTVVLSGTEYAVTNQWGGDSVFEALLAVGRQLGCKIEPL